MHRRGVAAISLGLALHLALAGLVVWLFSQRPAEHGPPRASAAAPLVRAIATAGPQPGPRPERPDDLFRDVPSPAPVDLFGFNADVGKVRARWDALFPFLTALPTFEVAAAVDGRPAGASLVFVDVSAPPHPAPARSALSMSAAAIQRLVDRTWTRRERWSRFGEVVALARRHHPDAGRLPAVIRSYVEQNLLQPYEETSPTDPRRWVMLVLAADDRDYLDFVVPYVRAHPRTRTATELLFLVDALMEGNGNALALLVDTDPRRELLWTAHENPQAWVLFDALRDYYRDRLRAQGEPTPAAIQRRYGDQRLQLLSAVLRVTPDGYRAGDAHFAIGKIRWLRGERAAAVREWRLIRVDRRDAFAATYGPIVEALAADPAAIPVPATMVSIEASLEAASRRWAAFHERRLRQFGFAASRF